MIGAMLDAPVRAAGWLAGTVRLEHVGGPRAWLDDEIVFAGELADQMTHALLSADRRKSEDSLRASEARYRSMLESMDDMVYICSDQYRVEYMNPAMIRRVGRDATGELCHASIHDLANVCPWCAGATGTLRAGAQHELTSPKTNAPITSRRPRSTTRTARSRACSSCETSRSRDGTRPSACCSRPPSSRRRRSS